MDAEHFDSITKVLATTGPRRRALGALLAALMGVLTSGWLASARRKKGNHHRKGQRSKNGNNRSQDVGKSGNKKKKKNKNKNDNKNPTPQPAPTPAPPAPPPSGCPSGLTACNGQCVNLQNDPNNCGLCGFSCAQFSPNTQCVNGSCPCNPGTATASPATWLQHLR